MSVIDDRIDLQSIKISDESYPAGELGPDDELIPTPDGQPTRFRRKVTKQKEVPFKRLVKVPVVTKEVVACEVEKRVPVKKWVEVQAYETVEEDYTEFEDVTKQRQKTVWKEVEVMERQMKKRPVQKTRKVKRPITKVVEEEIVQTIKVPGTKIEEVHGWRVDEYLEYKTVEQVDYEVYELIPHSTGSRELMGVRDLGRVETGEVSRTTGTDTYTAADVASGTIDISNVEEDTSVRTRLSSHGGDEPYYSTTNVHKDEKPATKSGRRRKTAGKSDAF